MPRTTVWITGATSGIGAALAASPRWIWEVLPPGPDTPAVVLLGEMIAPPRPAEP
jgi:hypothetical protein